jgi:hypothetical protein
MSKSKSSVGWLLLGQYERSKEEFEPKLFGSFVVFRAARA